MYALSKVWYMFIIFSHLNICHNEEIAKQKIVLPSFRMQVEEVTEDATPETASKDDPQSNLVSFLVKNVRKIFGELDDLETSQSKDNDTDIDESTVIFRPTIEMPSSIITETMNKDITTDIVLHKGIINTTLNSLLENSIDKSNISNEISNAMTVKSELMHLSKDLSLYNKLEEIERNDNAIESISYSTLNSSTFISDDSRRSCIICDNIALDECNDPKNKLIPSVLCKHDDDLCYSRHTPFGLIDRGCFSVNHNLSIYVCSCNLCNYISISEMPYIFSKKRDWIDNVVELSRTRNFKKSIYKGMSCLRCEVNANAKAGDMLDNANCLEGNIGNLPTEECLKNEICGVKAIRGDGYIWRGCVKTPLYNYWWTFCDNDLCNYDAIASVYDLQ